MSGAVDTRGFGETAASAYRSSSREPMIAAGELLAVLNELGALEPLDPRLSAAQIRRLYDLRSGKQREVGLGVADAILTVLGAGYRIHELVPPATSGKRSGPWSKPHPSRKLSAEQIAAAHKLHVDGGLSLRELGRQLWERLGYASAKTCAMALSDAFTRAGLPRRSRVEATIAASTVHGRGARATKASYKRWHRATFGPWPSDRRRSRRSQEIRPP